MSLGHARLVPFALTKAWVITVITSGVLLIALAILRVWNSAIYFQNLPQALQLIGDEAPRLSIAGIS